MVNCEPRRSKSSERFLFWHLFKRQIPSRFLFATGLKPFQQLLIKSKMNTQESIFSLINLYNQLTGAVAKPMVYEATAFGFLRAGFTVDDLKTIILYLQAYNRTNAMKMSLDLRILLGDLERTNDILSRAKSRLGRQTTPAQQVTNEFRRFTAEDTNIAAQNVSEVMARMNLKNL